MYYPYATLHSHQPSFPSLSSPRGVSSLPTETLYRALQAERQFVPLAFRKLVPPRCNTPPSPFDLSILPLSLSHSLLRFKPPLPHRPSRSPISLPSLFLLSSSYLVIPRSVHDIHFVRISRGGFQARKPPPSRGSTSGKRETSNGFALSSIPLFPLLLHLPIRPSLYLPPFSPLSLCVFPQSLRLSCSASICISSSLITYHVPPRSLSLSRPLSIHLTPRILPVHRKVVVPGMRLIPREYQEPSKRTEVG